MSTVPAVAHRFVQNAVPTSTMDNVQKPILTRPSKNNSKNGKSNVALSVVPEYGKYSAAPMSNAVVEPISVSNVSGQCPFVKEAATIPRARTTR